MIDLRIVIEHYPRSIDSRSQLSSLLHDLYPTKKKEVNVVLAVYDSGIVNRISKYQSLDSTQIRNFIKQLMNEYGLQEKVAAEGIVMWARAYGIEISTDSEAIWFCVRDEQVYDNSSNEPNMIVSQKESEIIQQRQYENGKIIQFGYFGPKNSLQKIDWIVLDSQGDKTLLLSRYALCTMPFCSQSGKNGWKYSRARQWLNSQFFDNSFSKEEKSIIISTQIHTNANRDDETEDYIFLLDREEYLVYGSEKYLGDNTKLMMRCLPTPFPEVKWGQVYANVPYCRWWLRGPCEDKTKGSIVSYFGNVLYEKIYQPGVGVRPAMWINL